MDILGFISSNIVALVSLVSMGGMGVAWLFDGKKRDNEVGKLRLENKTTEANVLKEIQTVYKTFVEDASVQLAQLADVRVENGQLKAEKKQLILENDGLRHQISLLEKRLKKYEP